MTMTTQGSVERLETNSAVWVSKVLKGKKFRHFMSGTNLTFVEGGRMLS